MNNNDKFREDWNMDQLYSHKLSPKISKTFHCIETKRQIVYIILVGVFLLICLCNDQQTKKEEAFHMKRHLKRKYLIKTRHDEENLSPQSILCTSIHNVFFIFIDLKKNSNDATSKERWLPYGPFSLQ